MDAVKAAVRQAQTYMVLEEDEVDFVQYGTREHGDVGEETASPLDVAEARRVKAAIRAAVPDAIVRMEVIDEWVTLTVRSI